MFETNPVQCMVLWWKDVLTEEGLTFYNCCTSTDKWIHGLFLAGDQEKSARSGARC